jgi:hypothetical protein
MVEVIPYRLLKRLVDRGYPSERIITKPGKGGKDFENSGMC